MTEVELKPGLIVDERYEVIAHLGDGGMGSVFKARERELNRLVALKILDPELSKDTEWRARFVREGRALSQLSHPNVLTIYRLGVWGGIPFIAMEYLEGHVLMEELSDGPLPWQRAVRIAMQICDGMSFAHQKRIIHRDLKPANIMLLNKPHADFVKVLDFGLARIAGSATTQSQSLTQTGSLIGSVHYMSPEQCLGQKADHRADIYALGCLLFEAICGEPPFEADNPIGLMHKHVSEPVRLVTSCPGLSDLPKQLDALIVKAVSKDLHNRYQTMDEFKQDLLFMSTGEFGRVEADGSAEIRRTKMRKAVIAAAGAGAVSLAVAGFFTFTDEGALQSFQLQHSSPNGAPDKAVADALSEADKLAGQKRPGAAVRVLEYVVTLSSKAPPSKQLLSTLYLRLARLYADSGDSVRGRRFAEAALLSYVDYLRGFGSGKHGIQKSDAKAIAATIDTIAACGGACHFDYYDFVQIRRKEYILHSLPVPLVPKPDAVQRSLVYLSMLSLQLKTEPARAVMRALRQLEAPVMTKMRDPFFSAFYWETTAECHSTPAERRPFLIKAAQSYGAFQNYKQQARIQSTLLYESPANSRSKQLFLQQLNTTISKLPPVDDDQVVSRVCTTLAVEKAMECDYKQACALFARAGRLTGEQEVTDSVFYVRARGLTGQDFEKIADAQSDRLVTQNKLDQAVQIELQAAFCADWTNQPALALHYYERALRHADAPFRQMLSYAGLLDHYALKHDATRFNETMKSAEDLVKDTGNHPNLRELLACNKVCHLIRQGNYKEADQVVADVIAAKEEYRDPQSGQYGRVRVVMMTQMYHYGIIGEHKRALQHVDELRTLCKGLTGTGLWNMLVLCGRLNESQSTIQEYIKLRTGDEVDNFDCLLGLISLLKGDSSSVDGYIGKAEVVLQGVAPNSQQGSWLETLKIGKLCAAGKREKVVAAVAGCASFETFGLSPTGSCSCWRYLLMSEIAAANKHKEDSKFYLLSAQQALAKVLGTQHPAVKALEERVRSL